MKENLFLQDSTTWENS